MVKITFSFHHTFNRNKAGRFLILMTAQKVDVISILPSFYKWENRKDEQFCQSSTAGGGGITIRFNLFPLNQVILNLIPGLVLWCDWSSHPLTSLQIPVVSLGLSSAGPQFKIQFPHNYPGLKYSLLIEGRPYGFLSAFILHNFFFLLFGKHLMIWNILSVIAIKWNTLHSIKLCTLSSWRVIVLCFLGNILLGEHLEFSSTSTPHEWLVFSLWFWGICQSQCRLFEVSASFSLALTQWTGNGSQKNKMGFPEVSADRKSACNARDIEDAGSIPGLGRATGGGKWQPTPVFLPEKSYGQRSLVGYSPGSHKSWTWLNRTNT